MHTKKFPLLTLIFLLPLFAPAQSADPIIKKYIEFIGGEKKWRKIKTLTLAGEYNYGGMKFPFHSYAKATNLYKFVVPFQGKHYTQSFDGKKGWRIDAFKNETTPTILTGKEAEAMANEANVELEDPFIDYKQKGHRALMEGRDTVDGKSCSRIKFTRQNGDEETYYFDEQTGAILMKIALSKNIELQGTMLTTRYGDYRDVNGIKIPFKSSSTSNDQLILEITVTKAETNVTIDEHEFQF